METVFIIAYRFWRWMWQKALPWLLEMLLNGLAN
jgi:hypothetical protein